MKLCARTVSVFLLLSFIFTSGCAFDLAHVKFDPVQIIACETDCREIHVVEELKLNNLPCGYNRVIKKDTLWRKIGSIQEGDVLKPSNQCFTVECSNVFEAYLVMVGDQLNGFYLPVQDGFVALKKPVQVIIEP